MSPNVERRRRVLFLPTFNHEFECIGTCTSRDGIAVRQLLAYRFRAPRIAARLGILSHNPLDVHRFIVDPSPERDRRSTFSSQIFHARHRPSRLGKCACSTRGRFCTTTLWSYSNPAGFLLLQCRVLVSCFLSTALWRLDCRIAHWTFS